MKISFKKHFNVFRSEVSWKKEKTGSVDLFSLSRLHSMTNDRS